MSEMATILGHIGNTPLLRLRHVSDALGVDIFVKCEFTNPGGSIKDRMALCMIEEAEKRGELKPGGTIVDQSTGNTGPALSFVGNVKGYKVQIFLPVQLSVPMIPRIGSDCRTLWRKCDSDRFERAHGKCRSAARSGKSRHLCRHSNETAYDLQQSDSSIWWANQLCNVDNTRAHGNLREEKSWNRWMDKLMAGWLPWGQEGHFSVWPRP